MTNSYINLKEITNLATMLNAVNIPFEVFGYFDGAVVKYPSIDKEVCSVICHKGSYGHAKGLLEIMGLLTEEEEAYDSVVGWLTAEDVFTRIAEHYVKEMKK